MEYAAAFVLLYFICSVFRFNSLMHRRCKRCRFNAWLVLEAFSWPLAWFYVLFVEGEEASLCFFTYPHAARGARCVECRQEITHDADTEWNFID